jgi:hypothetical protein
MIFYRESEILSGCPMDRLVTKTLAEIYLQQGHLEEAYSLFKALSDRDPEDVELKNRLKELEEKMKLLAQDEELPGYVDMSAPPPIHLDKMGQEHPADWPTNPSMSTQSTSPAPRKIQNLEKWLNNIRERRKP